MSKVINGKEYVVGLLRESGSNKTHKSHLYNGSHDEPRLPMCHYGWNKVDGYSIWRGNYGLGVCKICVKRANLGLEGISN